MLQHLPALLAHLLILYSTAMSSRRGPVLIDQTPSQPQTALVRVLRDNTLQDHCARVKLLSQITHCYKCALVMP